jgi:epoxyqueuosine reductase
MAKPAQPFIPSPEQMALWPAESGNHINGLGETTARRPRPIYWHDPDATPHGPLQRWFQQHNAGGALLARARAERQQVLDMPLSPLAAAPAQRDATEWTRELKQLALAAGADIVGVARMQPQWVYDGFEVSQRFIVMLGVAHDYERMKTAPEEPSFAEVVTQYARGNRVAKALASWLREQGHEARPHGGPMAGPVTLIPAALACGFGELGKHGSIIHRELGSSFRLASVLTDVPLLDDAPDTFGADDFCLRLPGLRGRLPARRRSPTASRWCAASSAGMWTSTAVCPTSTSTAAAASAWRCAPGAGPVWRSASRPG